MLEKIPGQVNLADVETKILSGPEFTKAERILKGILEIQFSTEGKMSSNWNKTDVLLMVLRGHGGIYSTTVQYLMILVVTFSRGHDFESVSGE